MEKVDEIIKVERDRYVRSHDIAKGLNIDHQTVLNHFNGSDYKKFRHLGVPRIGVKT